jgi:hypothetical protein
MVGIVAMKDFMRAVRGVGQGEWLEECVYPMSLRSG